MAEDFGENVRKLWSHAEEADKKNREEALADLEFASGEHWDKQVRQYREQIGMDRYGFPLPCLTINTIPAIVGTVTGDRRANEVAIKVLPNEEGDKQSADTRSEIIRSIESRSKAQRVYLSAFSAMVDCGISNFRVDLDYAYDDAFERDIFIRSIPNPLAVLWDPMAADPTGRDAGYCFVADKISKDEYKRRFKDDPTALSLDAQGIGDDDWVSDDSVRVAEYHTIVEKPRVLAMMQDGTVQDVTDKPEASYMQMVLVNPTTQKPMIRKAPRKFARMVMTNGRDEISDPFELPLCRLPIIRVSGQEIWVGDKRVRFGLVRFARDPARLKDYWRSLVAEKLMLSPRANYIASAAAIEGREDDWPNTLVYNETAATPPQAITQQDLAAFINEAQMCSEDIKDTTGIFDASRGMKSNETSGVAIARRQQEGDIATIGYHDNMNSAQQEAGEVINDLLPIAYDTARTLRLIGQNEAVKFMKVNDPLDPEAVDLSKGRYDVTVSTGPAYATRRMESSAQLMELAGRSPKLAEVAPDLLIDALDLPNGDEFKERLKRTVPPEILGADADDDLTPEEKANKQQEVDQAKQIKDTMIQLEMRLKTANAEEAEAKAKLANAQAEAAEKGTDNLIAGYNAETQRIKAITAKDFPLPPEAVAILAPIVTQAVMQALGSPDVLPLHPEEESAIADGALREAATNQINEQAANQPPAQDEAA